MIYRISLGLSDFILEQYSPLRFAVGWLLDKAEEASRADDPFVLLYRIKWYMKTGDTEKLMKVLENAIVLQPDFLPILRLAGDYYELIGKQDQAIETFAHILELYPGEPAWLRYEKKIIDYKENITM
jgi:tetratricopeptide (TPR) repeat protein